VSTAGLRTPLEPGQPAPDFILSLGHRAGVVSLADYPGESAVFLAFDRGLYCCFCRRHFAELGTMSMKLKATRGWLAGDDFVGLGSRT
jgi:peroxiredoxin